MIRHFTINGRRVSSVVTAEVSPARSYPELFQVTGPLQSLVFRTEDVWQRCTNFIETAGSQSGFPLLTPTMQSGQDSEGGGGRHRGNVYAVCSGCVVVYGVGGQV